MPPANLADLYRSPDGTDAVIRAPRPTDPLMPDQPQPLMGTPYGGLDKLMSLVGGLMPVQRGSDADNHARRLFGLTPNPPQENSIAIMPGMPNPGRLPLTKVMSGDVPKQVYHGTPAAFDQFSLGNANPRGLYGPGLYFTENPNVASGYAKTRTTVGEPAPNVRPANLDVTKPFRADDFMGEGLTSRLAAEIDKKHGTGASDYALERLEMADRAGHNITGDLAYREFSKNAMDAEGRPIGQAAVNDALKALGFDGITHIGGPQGGTQHRVWITFDPKQVVDPFKYAAEYGPQLNNLLHEPKH